MILRLVLFLGLVFHKLVWEVMKPNDKASVTKRPTAPSLFKQLFKYLKIAALLFLLVQTLFLDLFPISDRPTLSIAGIAIYFLGLGTAVVARLQLGRNWANLEDCQVSPNQSLVRDGIYRYIRHPIYTGDILLLIGLELALNSWLVLAMVVPLVVFLKQAAEEEILLSQALENYQDYCRQTKRFIPFLL